MRINGKKIEGLNIETIIIPRAEGQDIVFKAQAIPSFKEFEKLCPEPKPPFVIDRNGQQIPDVEDTRYNIALTQFAKKRHAWMVITSLKATPGLDWELVKENEPDTWELYQKELLDSGFGDIEIGYIIKGVMAANCLSTEKLNAAYKRFLAGQGRGQNDLSSPNTEQKIMPSGEHVNGSKSDLQESKTSGTLAQ